LPNEGAIKNYEAKIYREKDFIEALWEINKKKFAFFFLEFANCAVFVSLKKLYYFP
jgi:hypothetical protein